MRSEPGFVLGSDDAAADAADACNAPLISSDDDWAAARPSLRLSEVRRAYPDVTDVAGVTDVTYGMDVTVLTSVTGVTGVTDVTEVRAVGGCDTSTANVTG